MQIQISKSNTTILDDITRKYLLLINPRLWERWINVAQINGMNFPLNVHVSPNFQRKKLILDDHFMMSLHIGLRKNDTNQIA
jgi:hypothetical protein